MPTLVIASTAQQFGYARGKGLIPRDSWFIPTADRLRGLDRGTPVIFLHPWLDDSTNGRRRRREFADVIATRDLDVTDVTT